MSPGFWRGRRVFLTGHTGFKGAWLSLLLARLGARVHGTALAPVPGGLYASARVAETLAGSTIGDIRDARSLRAALDASGADTVIHMAAQALVRPGYESPVETFAVNVMGTVHLLNALRGGGVEAALIVTSDKAYEGRADGGGHREDDPLGGHDPYSASKACAELATAAYRRSFFGPDAGCRPLVASARAGNVIGGGDVSRDRIVPDLVRAFRAGTPAAIRNPRAVRPWQHVLEPLAGYLALIEALCGAGGAAFACGWNFGPDAGCERSVADLAEAACRAWGGDARWQAAGADGPHEAARLVLDSTQARERLGWRPRWDFDTAVAESVAWYRAQGRGADTRAVTDRQIDAYLASTRATDRGAGPLSRAGEGGRRGDGDPVGTATDLAGARPIPDRETADGR